MLLKYYLFINLFYFNFINSADLEKSMNIAATVESIFEALPIGII